jgi:hypothetical protein
MTDATPTEGIRHNVSAELRRQRVDRIKRGPQEGRVPRGRRPVVGGDWFEDDVVAQRLVLRALRHIGSGTKRF